VSAGVSARSTLAAVRRDRVRALQHVLYRAAKADPNRRFHSLRDKVYREDVLQRAWYAVRRNNGAPGIDKITLADAEEHGVTRLLGELAGDLREGAWRPLPARRVLIPKPGSSEGRPLAIAAGICAVRQLAARLPRRAWQRYSAGEGAKGHRYYDWAWAAIDPGRPGHRWLLIRRNRRTRELAFYRC
jgi:hypothetical protein